MEQLIYVLYFLDRCLAVEPQYMFSLEAAKQTMESVKQLTYITIEKGKAEITTDQASLTTERPSSSSDRVTLPSIPDKDRPSEKQADKSSAETSAEMAADASAEKGEPRTESARGSVHLPPINVQVSVPVLTGAVHQVHMGRDASFSAKRLSNAPASTAISSDNSPDAVPVPVPMPIQVGDSQ